MSADSLAGTTYLRDVQGLRAIAILLVVLAHAGVPGISGGFIGVDVFFVLSGFLITGLLLAELEKTDSINFLNFYSRRLKRLLPALLAMIVLVTLVTGQLLPGNHAFSLTRSAIYAATWTSNLYFSFRDIDYFNELETSDLFLHTWSLGVEEQFYLVWPVILCAAYWLASTAKSHQNRHRSIFLILLTIGITSWLLSMRWLQQEPMWAYYMMPARVWQFSLGACVSILSIRRHTTPPNGMLSTPIAQGRLQLLGVTLILVSVAVINTNKPYPGYQAILPSLGTALVLFSTNSFRESALLSHPVLTWLGDRSYSWYLWHWPVLKLAEALNIEKGLLSTCALIAISLTLAAVCYSLIERPFWRGKLSKFSPPRVILTSIISMMLVCTISLLLLQRDAKIDQGALAQKIQKSKSDLPIIYQDNCDTWYESDELTPCIFGENQDSKTVVLFGDSVLAQWFSLFASIYSSPEWRVVVFTKSSCPMVDEDFFYSRIGKNFAVCTRWRNKVLDTLDKIKPELIIAGGAAGGMFTEEEFIGGSKRIFKRLTQAADHVFIIPGTPKLQFNGPNCLMKHLGGDGEHLNFHQLSKKCSSQAKNTLANKASASLTNAARGVDGIKLLDLNPFVCEKDSCSAITDSGEVIFRDNQHLTDTFVLSLVPRARQLIQSL
jgi:peptidoglycan/LPS O-acetylase OafA/YrhL